MKKIFFIMSIWGMITTSSYAESSATNNYTCTLKVEDGMSGVNKIKVEGEGESAVINFDLQMTSDDGADLGKLSGQLTYKMDIPENPEGNDLGKDMAMISGKISGPDGEEGEAAFVISKGMLRGEETGKMLMMGPDEFYVFECKKEI